MPGADDDADGAGGLLHPETAQRIQTNTTDEAQTFFILSSEGIAVSDELSILYLLTRYVSNANRVPELAWVRWQFRTGRELKRDAPVAPGVDRGCLSRVDKCPRHSCRYRSVIGHCAKYRVGTVGGT